MVLPARLVDWLPSWLAALLGCAALWLLWSLLVGSVANHLPDQLLERQPRRLAEQTGSTQPAQALQRALRRYQSRLGIRRWKPWIPDAGAALPGGVSKASLARRDPLALQRLLLETRRAELVHWALWPAWMATALWLPPAGVVINLIFATLFNLPCLLLQRYNRLRLRLALSRMKAWR
jgi:glycosyl-4,4'-diaponeurosporenoate acyltransferase